MANFRIDELELFLDTNTNKYNLFGLCNASSGNQSNHIVGNQIGTDLNFIGFGDISDKKFSFSVAALDFSMFPDDTDEMLNLNFSDDLVAKPKRGGVLIKDTKYPPPNQLLGFAKHAGFSKQFTIQSIKCNNRDLLGRHNIEIRLSYKSLFAFYNSDSLDVHTDTLRNFQKTMNLKVEEIFDGNIHESPPNPPLVFNRTVGLDRQNGVPIIVINMNTVWNMDIDVKKANIFIE